MPFTQEQIETYSRYVGQPITDESGVQPEDRLHARDIIKEAHRQVTLWSKNVRDVISPNGSIPDKQIRATNQVGNFRDYLPQTFYPNFTEPSNLLYWIYLWCDRTSPNHQVYFRVLLGLNDDTADRQLKARFRQYKESIGGTDSLTSMLPVNEGLDMSMEKLTSWAVNAIRAFPVSYDQVRNALEPDLSLNDSRIEVEKFSGFWIEKCGLVGRSHREQGEYSLGHVMWSPQRSASGQRVSDILCKRGSFTAEAFFPQT